MNRKTVFLGWARIVFGLLIFALGVHCTIRADLGLAPWDCFGMGISYHTPLNYGLSMTVRGVVSLLIDVLRKEKTRCSRATLCSCSRTSTRSRRRGAFGRGC